MYQTNPANYGKLTKLNTIVAIGVKEKGELQLKLPLYEVELLQGIFDRW